MSLIIFHISILLYFTCLTVSKNTNRQGVNTHTHSIVAFVIKSFGLWKMKISLFGWLGRRQGGGEGGDRGGGGRGKFEDFSICDHKPT